VYVYEYTLHAHTHKKPTLMPLLTNQSCLCSSLPILRESWRLIILAHRRGSVCVCMYAYVHGVWMDWNEVTYAHIHTHMQIRLNICIHMHVHIHTHAYTIYRPVATHFSGLNCKRINSTGRGGEVSKYALTPYTLQTHTHQKKYHH